MTMTPVPTTGELVLARQLRATPAEVAADVAALQEVMRAALVDGQHYGRIPGTPRPSLYKAGAEWLLKWAGYGHALEAVEVERDDDTGRKYAVTYRCSVHLLHDADAIVATCDGYAGYDEARWAKSGWNTILKMAQKRALVGAALQATGASGLFTQDLEDEVLPTEKRATSEQVKELGGRIAEAGWDGAPEARAALKDWMTGQEPALSFTRPMSVGELGRIEAKWAELTPAPESPDEAPEATESAAPADDAQPAPEATEAAQEDGTPPAELERCSECKEVIPADASRLRDADGLVWCETCLDVPAS